MRRRVFYMPLLAFAGVLAGQAAPNDPPWLKSFKEAGGGWQYALDHVSLEALHDVATAQVVEALATRVDPNAKAIPGDYIAVICIRILALKGGSEATQALQRVADQSSADDHIRYAAVLGLWKSGAPEDALARLLDSPNKYVRAGAIEALAASPNSMIQDRLTDTLKKYAKYSGSPEQVALGHVGSYRHHQNWWSTHLDPKERWQHILTCLWSRYELVAKGTTPPKQVNSVCDFLGEKIQECASQDLQGFVAALRAPLADSNYPLSKVYIVMTLQEIGEPLTPEESKILKDAGVP